MANSDGFSSESGSKNGKLILDPMELFTHLYLNCSFLVNTSDVFNTSVYGTNETCSNADFEKKFTDPVDSGSFWIRLMVLVLYGIVCIVGLLGNSLVIYVVVRFSKMQTVTNLYIVNLAIADECFLVGIPFLMATTALEYWPFGDFMCKVYFTTTSINQVTSSMFLLIMSADRFLAVCHPISATKLRTSLIATMVAVTAWGLSAFIMVPVVVYANTRSIHGTINCNIFWPNGWIKGEATFMLYFFVLGFAVPLTLISVFYFQVVLRLRNVGPKRHSLVPPSMAATTTMTTITAGRALNSMTNTTTTTSTLSANQSSRAKERKRSHRKVTKLVLTVIAVYFLCWAPYWMSQLALISMEHDTHHSQALLTIFLLAGCLSYSNSAMNPILYAFLSDNFKKSFVKACSCASERDVNAILARDNSLFPRKRRGKKLSERRRGTSDNASRSPNPNVEESRLLAVNRSHNSQHLLNESSNNGKNPIYKEECV